MNPRSFIATLLGVLLLSACLSSPTATPTAGPALPKTNQPTPSSTLPPPTPTVPSPTATLAPPSLTPLPPVATAKIIVNVRSGPSASYSLLGKLKTGDRRPILGKSQDGKWWLINYDGRQGWIPADLTDVQGGTNVVAVVLVEPLPTSTPLPTRISFAGPPAPKPTPTVPFPSPAGRLYFVVQGHAAWLRPELSQQIFSDVIIGPTGDFNPNLSTNASPIDWSEAAGKLAYAASGGAQDKLQTIDQNANVLTLASHGAIVTPRWFGDGSQIAFVGYDNNFRNNNIYVVRAFDGTPTLTCSPRPAEQFRGLTVNRRNGDIAFVSNYSGKYELWKMDRNCAGLVKLTNDNADITAPAFSPDGNFVVYASNKTSPSDYEIYVMPSAGGAATRLGEGFAPVFSPDGNWLAFARNLEVYIMDRTGGNVQPLAPGDRPAWAP